VPRGDRPRHHAGGVRRPHVPQQRAARRRAEVPEKLGDEAWKRLKADWSALHESPENWGKVAILEQGTDWKSIGASPVELDFIEQRKFSTVQIARIFRCRPG
jgi:phage portal protein BeeE